MFAVSNNAGANAQAGPDLPEITTEALGFLSIAGETKLRLLPSPWPSDALPKPTSTLFGVASRNELLAAAGPDKLVIASTTAIREAYTGAGAVENNVKQFAPQLTISIPRISHLAFSSDEAFLIIAADEGGGLQVHEVNTLKQGNTQPAFALPTNGISIRALVPNPAAENGHIIAVVLTDGKLMLADLKSRAFSNGSNGMILRENVSCISWSVKGKQLVAGLGDGTAVQLDPAGVVKAEIPRPPQLNGDGDPYVSGLSWLANDQFWFIYTPSKFPSDNAPDSHYFLVNRQPKTTNYQFQQMPDPCPPFGMNRSPPHHFNVRIKDFPPNLNDAIIVASTASPDIGVITSSKTPLSPDAQQAVNMYTTTSMAIDSRRAQLPPDENLTDTSAIGIALDLSSTQPVKRPIPSEEFEQSHTPLPALMVLNNEGILSTWWFVYSESVRQGSAYPGLVAAAGGQAPAPAQAQPSGAFGTFGQSQSSTNTFGQPAQPTTSTFGAPAAFGVSSKIPVSSSFGASSALGANKSVWGAPAASGQTGGTTFGQAGGSTFGKPAFGAPAFGQSGGAGQTQSPWGSQPSKPVFGQPGAAAPFGGNTSTASPFATAGSDNKGSIFGGNTSTASPFATAGTGNNENAKPVFGSNFGATTSQASPFATATAGKPSWASGNTGTNVFGSQQSSVFGAPAPPSDNVFGQPAKPSLPTQTSVEAEMTDDSPMGTNIANTPVSAQADAEKKSVFGSTPFKLGSRFKPDGSAKDDLPKGSTGPSFFGQAFGNTLAEASKAPAPSTPIKEEPKSPKGFSVPSTTPPSLPRPAPAVAAPPATGGFVKGDGELKPFVPPTQPELTSTPTQKRPEQVEELTSTPTQKRPEQVEEPPLPPSPSASRAEFAPFPPSPKATKGPAEDKEPSGAGSPPVDLGASGSPSLSPAESIRSDEIAAAKAEEAPLPPDFLPKASSIPKPSWSFPTTTPSKDKRPASPDANASPLPGTTDTPLSFAPTQASQTPASATKPPFAFQPSESVTATPRSPSPARPSRFGQSLLTPKPQPQSLFSTTPLGPPPPKPQLGGSMFNNPPTPRHPSHAASSQSDSANVQTSVQPEQRELVDDDDARIREELSEPVEPTKQLAPFMAHQDYVGKVSGQGVPAQIEKVYRDINSMIDTLGLNARSLAAFIKGHSELYMEGERDTGHLEEDEVDDWCLTEIDDLGIMQKMMGQSLDAERIQDVRAKVTELQDLQHDLSKLRVRNASLQKLLSARQAKNNNARNDQLSTEQVAVLTDIRKDFSSFQQLLAQAEDSVSMLKAKVAAAQQANGSDQAAVPTVEAVINTITKMTRMIEQKSGDIDLLEAQMKRLKFRTITRGTRAGTPTTLDEALGRLSLGSNGGRGDSPFQTPPSSRSKLGRSTYALTYSPDTSEDEGANLGRSFRSSMRSSVGASAGKTKARLPRVSEEEIKAYGEKQARKRQVMLLLKQKLEQRSAGKATSA